MKVNLSKVIGSDIILDGIDDKGEISEEARVGVSALLKRSFRPEFLNRLDEIIFYKPLTRDNMEHIIDLMLAGISKRLEEKQLKLVLTDEAKQFVIDHGYDPAFGARPLKRYLQSHVETLAAEKIIRDDPAPGDTLTVCVENGGLVIK